MQIGFSRSYALPSQGTHGDHQDRLAACCRSIFALLLDLPSDLAIVDTLDYLLGAAYGLSKAHSIGFRDRSDAHLEKYEGHVAHYALSIAEGGEPQQYWLAGYHFNSGIQRLAAVFDRFSRLLGHDNREPAIDRMKAAAGPQQKWGKWYKVYREINDFKHKAEGRGQGRKVTFDDAVKGIEEAVRAFKAHKAALESRGQAAGGTAHCAP